jgi:hypothetical protein
MHDFLFRARTIKVDWIVKHMIFSYWRYENLMKTKYVASIVTTGLMLGGSSTAIMPMAAQAATTSNFTIIVEDKEVSYDVPPIFVHDRTFVPLRALSESLGATVDYNNTTKVATLTKDDIVLTLNFQTGVVKKNSAVIKMEEAPRFIHDRALVPLRFISQAFGNQVGYDAKTHTASVFPTQKTLDQRAAVKTVMDQVTAAMKPKTSFEMNLNLLETMPVPKQPNMTVSGNLLLDYTKNPLALYGKGVLTAPSTVPGATDLNLEMYLVDGKGYLKDPDTQKWVSDTVFTTEQLNQFMQMTTQQDAQSEAARIVLLPYMSMTDNGTSYTITTKLDAKGLKKLDQFDPTMQQQNNPILNDQLGLPDLGAMTITLGVDKTTFLETSFGITYLMSMPGTQPITATLSGTISKYDSIAPIQVPDDVLKSITDNSTTTK